MKRTPFIFLILMLIASARCKVLGANQPDRLNEQRVHSKSTPSTSHNIESVECTSQDSYCNVPPVGIYGGINKLDYSVAADISSEDSQLLLHQLDSHETLQTPVLLNPTQVLQHFSNMNWDSNGNTQSASSTSGFTATSSNTVQFFPASLNFEDRPICLLSAKSVDVVNHSPDQELQILSISTDSMYFYPSFFKQPISPGGNGSLTIMFLPRALGTVENSMVIQTNIGSFVYSVSGTGHANAYKVKPHIGIKLLPKASFNYTLEIYNPHPDTLEIVEVFTSGGFLQLTLPSNDKPISPTSSQVLWNILPFQRRQIIQMTFSSQTPGKYQSFVNIKSNKENLVIPVDVTVLRDGLHVMPEELEFGTLTLQEHSSIINISVINAEPTPVTLYNVTYASFSDSQIKDINITIPRNLIIPAFTERFYIGQISFSTAIEGNLRGKLVFQVSTGFTVNNNMNGASTFNLRMVNQIADSKLEVPVKGKVVFGSLSYVETNTTFPVVFSSRRNCKLLTPQEQAIFEPKLLPVSRVLALTNTFNVPITVFSAEIESPNFRILVNSKTQTPVPLSLALPHTIPAGSSWPGLSLTFLANSTNSSYTTQLILETNASTLVIPLRCYHGLLHYSIQESNVVQQSPSTKIGCIDRVLKQGIDFGVIGAGDLKSKTFTIHNLNPVKIPINSIKVNFPNNAQHLNLAIKLDHVRNAHNISTVNVQTHSADLSELPLLELEPSHSATFTVQLTATLSDRNREQHGYGEIIVQTTSELTSIPVSFDGAEGFLSAVQQLITFDGPAFPGKVRSVVLEINSTFNHAIQITSMVSSDRRITPIMSSDWVTVLPNQVSRIATLLFDPTKGASELPHTMNIGLAEPHLTSFDLKKFKKWELYWNKLHEEQLDQIEATITLNSDIAIGADFGLTIPVKAILEKPSVLPSARRSIQFPKVQIGEETAEEIIVENPADVPVALQLLPILEGSSSCFSVKSFLVGDQIIVLQPKAQQVIGQIVFRPNALGVCETSLFIRNNLTIIEPLGLSGMGGSGKLVLQDIDPVRIRSPKTLEFPVGSHAQRLCKKTGFGSLKDPADISKDSLVDSSAVTVTKHLTALNIGDLPVYVQSIMIDDRPCEGYGFWVAIDKHISNAPSENVQNKCNAITLYPWESQNITIFYSPQMASSLQSRSLVLNTAQGALSYSLEVIIPSEYLPLCNSNRQQLEFDSILHKILVTVIIAVLIMLSAFGLREYQCFGERYLVRPLQVAVVAKESLPFEYSDPSISLQVDSERDIPSQHTDKEKDWSFSAHKDKTTLDLESHSMDGTLAHHILPPAQTNCASPNSGDQAQPHVSSLTPIPRIADPVAQPSKLKDKKVSTVVSPPATQNILPKPAEEKKKEPYQEIHNSKHTQDSNPPEIAKNTSSTQPLVVPPAVVQKPVPLVQENTKRKASGKKELSNVNNEKQQNIPMKAKPIQEPVASHKLDASNNKAKRKTPPSSELHNRSGSQVSVRKDSSLNSESKDQEVDWKIRVEKRLDPEANELPVTTQPLQQQPNVSQSALNESNWTPSWFWGYSNAPHQLQPTNNNALQYPYTAVSAEKSENGISSMDTANDLRCYSPKRGPAIGVIGSGKRENDKRRERDSRFAPMFSQQTSAVPSNFNMDMMFDNTRILNATEPWGQLTDAAHTSISNNLSMVWPSTMEPHTVTTTPYARQNYPQPELQPNQFGFQSEDLYNTSSLFSSFTPLTMNLGSFHQIQPISTNGADIELDQEIDPNSLQFQFDSPEFLQ